MHRFCPISITKTLHMKTLILAAFIIIGLASCSVTQPNENVYPQQRVYAIPQYNPYYYDNTYDTRRVYDYNTGRYYDVPVYNAPVYSNRSYRRDIYRRDNERREYNTEYNRQTQQQPRYEQPRNQESRNDQPGEKRLPDGTRISPDGTVTLPNGEVRRRQ